jgi:hypothetical protein
MARQTKTVELSLPGGLAATYAAAHADGHSMVWTKDLVLHVKQGAGARVLTIPVGETFEGRVITSRTVNVGASTEVFVGPFSQRYIQSDGTIWIDWDATTNTTFAALRLGVS